MSIRCRRRERAAAVIPSTWRAGRLPGAGVSGAVSVGSASPPSGEVRRPCRARQASNDRTSSACRSASRSASRPAYQSMPDRTAAVASGFAGHVTGPASYSRTSVMVRSGRPSGLYSDRAGSRFHSSARTSNMNEDPYAPARRPGSRSRLYEVSSSGASRCGESGRSSSSSGTPNTLSPMWKSMPWLNSTFTCEPRWSMVRLNAPRAVRSRNRPSQNESISYQLPNREKSTSSVPNRPSSGADWPLSAARASVGARLGTPTPLRITRSPRIARMVTPPRCSARPERMAAPPAAHPTAPDRGARPRAPR